MSFNRTSELSTTKCAQILKKDSTNDDDTRELINLLLAILATSSAVVQSDSLATLVALLDNAISKGIAA